MEEYTVLKPIHLRGKRYRIGERVPCEVVEPSQGARLTRAGYLGKQTNQSMNTFPCSTHVQEADICVPVHNKDGVQEMIFVTPGEIQAVFEIIQTDMKEAAEAVSQISSLPVLRIIYTCDSRKGIKEAAGKRASQVMQEQGNKEETLRTHNNKDEKVGAHDEAIHL